MYVELIEPKPGPAETHETHALLDWYAISEIPTSRDHFRGFRPVPAWALGSVLGEVATVLQGL